MRTRSPSVANPNVAFRTGKISADSLYGQLEAPAAEGAQPATPYTAGQAPKREHRGWWLTGITLLAALVSLALLTPGASA